MKKDFQSAAEVAKLASETLERFFKADDESKLLNDLMKISQLLEQHRDCIAVAYLRVSRDWPYPSSWPIIHSLVDKAWDVAHDKSQNTWLHEHKGFFQQAYTGHPLGYETWLYWCRAVVDVLISAAWDDLETDMCESASLTPHDLDFLAAAIELGACLPEYRHSDEIERRASGARRRQCPRTRRERLLEAGYLRSARSKGVSVTPKGEALVKSKDMMPC